MTQGDLFDAKLGEALKQVGMQRARDGSREWTRLAEVWVTGLRDGRHFTADDLVKAIGLPESRNVVGATLSGLARRRLIKQFSHAKSQRADRHSGSQAVWERVPEV